MAKKKSSGKTARKPVQNSAASNGRSRNGAVKKTKVAASKLTRSRLRKLAKKHRPPDEYFVGEMERPW